MKVTMADLDRLIRLEEFLKENQRAEGTKTVLCWDSGDGKSEKAED
jgi:hypothetical protein